jgi:2-phospho-L-lactate guanylyltransferase
MKALLIPVKELSKAKQRLAAHFSPEDRFELADALWQDFFKVAATVRGIDSIFVVSTEERVLERARELGWEIIPESHQVSESDSVNFASQWCADRGVDVLLRVPVDLPLIESSDIEAIFNDAPLAPAAVIVPSFDGTGTNALLRTPPTLFPSHFGPGSFTKHLIEASRCGAETRVLRLPGIEIDIDELVDVSVLRARELRPSLTRDWLQAHGVVSALGAAAGASGAQAERLNVEDRKAAGR